MIWGIEMTESDIEYSKLKRGDNLIYARIMPKIEYYELLDVHLVSHNNEYCTVTDIKTRQTYLIEKRFSKYLLYTNRKLALKYLKEQKEKNKDLVVFSE